MSALACVEGVEKKNCRGIHNSSSRATNGGRAGLNGLRVTNLFVRLSHV